MYEQVKLLQEPKEKDPGWSSDRLPRRSPQYEVQESQNTVQWCSDVAPELWRTDIIINDPELLVQLVQTPIVMGTLWSFPTI